MGNSLREADLWTSQPMGLQFGLMSKPHLKSLLWELENRLVKLLLDWTWDHSPILLSVFSC